MLTLTLDPTDDRANPVFKDVAGCKKWLGQFQLTNLHAAHGELRAQMDELNRYPMRGVERLLILEQLSETIEHVQTGYARKLIAKKLPLSDDELTIFVSIIGLWQQMINGYQRCLQAVLAGDRLLAPYTALLCQRSLLYSGLQIFEYSRTGYEFNNALWQQLHELYAFSEERGFQMERVANELGGEIHTAACHAIYVKTLLACYARPAELTRSQLKLLDQWLMQWSAFTAVERGYNKSKGDAPPLAVDLASAHGLQPLTQMNIPHQQTNQDSDSVRYLAMLPLSKMLRVKTVLLQQGQSPQQLELGEECSSAECVEMLEFLHRCWCEGIGDRLSERHHTAQRSDVCYGLEAIYAHIANKPFKPLVRNGGVDELARKQIATFGRVLTETDHHSLGELGYPLESWQIENESMLGAHLLRGEIAGVRIGPNQIVAVRRDNDPGFMLGATSWVHVTQNGQLSLGVRYLPGIAQSITIKSTGVNLGMSDKSDAALLLPAMPALKMPASLVIPRDWLRPERIIEVVHADKQVRTVKLGFSVEKGGDYERVSFSLV